MVSKAFFQIRREGKRAFAPLLLGHQAVFGIIRIDSRDNGAVNEAQTHGRHLAGGPAWMDEVVLQQMHVQSACRASVFLA